MGGIIRHFIASMCEMFFDESGHFYLKKYDKIRVAFLVACTLGFILLSNLVAPIQFSEPDTEATSQSTQPSTLTLTSTTNTATVSINPTPTGVFGKSSDANSIKFNISTNNYSGYTISARTTRTTLVNGSSSLTSLASAVSESQFSNSGNTTLNNRWGYKPNYYNSSSNSNFLPSPGTSSSTLDHTTVANSTAKNYTIVLGARVNTEVPAGTYVNDTLVLEATANAVPYTIKFNKAADDDIVSNMPANKTGESVSANNVTLPSTVPTRMNYTFAGWCTTIPVASAGGYTCNGTTYTAGSDYNINFTVDNTDNNLYAIWTSNRGCNKAATTIGTGVTATDAVCMQDINDTVITSMTEGTQHTLIDMRDGKSYFIAKQADGKVWMTQNLDYDLSTSTTLTHNNTDLGYTTSNLNKTWTPARATFTGDVSSWHNDVSVVDSYDPGNVFYMTSGNTNDDANYMSCSAGAECYHYHIGNYYNWPAAIAGNVPSSTDQYTKAEDSVCPAGWRLINGPTSDWTFGEMDYLVVKSGYVSVYSRNRIENAGISYETGGFAGVRSSPFYLSRPGTLMDTGFANQRHAGNYWNNTESLSSNSVYISRTTTNYVAKATMEKNMGLPIRCVARMSTGTTRVNFNGNGATSGEMATRTVPSGDGIDITNEFEKEGHKFVKWNTAADGSGTDYPATVITVLPNQSLELTLYAQWEEAFIIKYDGNGATGSTTMSLTHEVADGEEITLNASNYSRAGYGFLGWSATQIDPDAVDFATQLANANIFGPNQTITAAAAYFNKSFPATVTLYAVWIKSAGNLQDWQGCSSMSNGDVTALKDTRDNEVYAVAKLDDGNCWMIENLRLEEDYSSDPSKSQGFGGNFAGLPTNGSIVTSTVENSLYTSNPDSLTKRIISGKLVEYRIPRYNDVNTVTNMVDQYSPTYSYGAQYNYAAATANTNLLDYSESNSVGTSICPAGWRLPTGGASGSDYTTLHSVINSGLTNTSAGLRRYPNNFVLGGHSTEATYYVGNSTYYLSATTYSGEATASYMLNFDRSASTVSNGMYKSSGGFVRCIKATGIEVKLDANDGSSRVARLYGTPGTVIGLPENEFYRNSQTISSWNTAANGSGTSYTTTYEIASNATSGITLYAQWSSAYNIRYHGNGATGDTNMDYFTHLSVTDGEEIVPFASNFSRTGYGFLGWSFTQINPDASNAATQIANTKIYGPNETITINSSTVGQSAPATVYLYAVWIKPSGTLQSWNGCNQLNKTTYNSSTGAITPGDVIALTDSRDNNVYAVARFADGSCWITENLRLDTTSTLTSITTANTNNPTADFMSNRNSIIYSCSSADETCANRYMAVESPSFVSYGMFYNFKTFSAGSGSISTNDNLSGDICPAGWHIPSTNASGSNIYSMLSAIGIPTSNTSNSTTPTGTVSSTRLRTYPYNFIYSGYIEMTSITSLKDKTWGYTATTGQFNNEDNYYYLFLGLSENSTRINTGKKKLTVGIPVRCVKNSGSITYDGNGATGSTTMSNSIHSNLNQVTSVKLAASNYSRSGYGFAGWSKTQINPDAADAATQIANATIYGPNETVDISELGSDDVTLYAVWIKSAGNLQNWTGCSSLAQGSVTALKDTRDNQVYAVAKLADGRCWMVENLRLDAANSTDPTKSQGFGGVFSGLADSEGVTFTVQAGENSKYTDNQQSTNLLVMRGGSLHHRLPRYSNISTASTVANMTSADSNVYSYGNYYNDHAALANTNDFTGKTIIEGTSICPAGWKLPSSTVDYTNMISSVGASNVTKYPNNFIYSGFIDFGVLSRGSIGYYITTNTFYTTATNNSRNVSNYYYYMMSIIATTTLSNGYYGASVRCVIPNNIEIKLEANDGSNRVARIYADAGSTVSIPYNIFDQEESSITSWNTAANGSGTSYSESYTVGSSNTTLYARWNDSYEILYDTNKGLSTPDGFSKSYHHTDVKSGDSIILYKNTTTRTGYAFLGWSTTQIDATAANATTQIANAKIFGPNETITANSTTLGVSAPATVTLYAVWLASSGTLQTWQGCGSLTAATYLNGIITPGSVIALTDSRDNRVYAVAKLADGRCWMINNLSLNPSTASITADNTNNPTETFLANRTTSYDSCTANTQDCIERILYSVYDTNPWDAGTTNTYGSGVYYNWYTATAGHGTTTATSTAGDICPTGWHLPTGGTSTTSEFASLNVSVGGLRQNLDATTTPTGAEVSARLRTYPYNLTYAGLKSYPTTTNATGDREYGYLWASNAFSNNGYYGYTHAITDTTAKLGTGYGKQNLIQIRCIKDASKITYNGNGADSNYRMSVTHSATPSSTITLYASNYKRAGYGFLGWSFTQIDPDASNFSTLLANATVYGPNQTITLPSTIPSDTLTLYAVWIKSAGNLQGWTGCSSMSTGSVTALKDTRDNQVYAVAKLADTNCWMIENLRLDAANSTDVTKAQGFGGVFEGLANSELATFAGVTTANSLYTADSSSITGTRILGDNLSTRFPRYNNTNTSNTVTNMTASTQNIYSYGNYYSFSAAKAHTGDLASTNASEYSGTSICPTGWRLPTAGSGKEFESLNTAVNSGSTTSSAGLRAYPNNFIYSGYIWSSAQSGYGTYGQYASGTLYSATAAYEMQISSASVNPARGVWRYLGDSVRCVAASGVTVTLNANDGSDRVAHVYVPSGTSVPLNSSNFENEGYTISSWNTNSGGTGTSYTTSYTASSNTTLYAQWAEVYTILYGDNGATSSTSMSNYSHQNIISGTTLMLRSNNIKRTGYGFLGWSTTEIDPDDSDATTQIANAKIFGPNETITANQATLGASAPATVTLYAVWLKSSGTMQDWLGCETLTQATYSNGTITPGSVIALTDNRDSETYAIARLTDGHCWMVESLRTNPATANITTSNTNGPTADFLTNRTSSYSWCTDNTQDCTERVLSTYASSSAYSGRYYNHYTATAGNSLFTTTGNVSGDLCPHGWYIPTGTNYTGIYGALGVSMGGPNGNADSSTSPTGTVLDARFRTYPNNFTWDGYISNGSLYSYRTLGYFWSGTGYYLSSSSKYYGDYLGLSTDYVRYSYIQQKQYGTQVRCIVTNASDPYTISYNGNSATGGTLTTTHSVIQGDTVRLSSPNFYRTGYGFVGWSFSSTATVGGSATIYGPNQTIEITGSILAGADNQRKLTLYAVWVAKDGTNTLQAFTESNCTSMSTGQIKVLTDSRDSNLYPIAKLADGNCWMIDNLRINPATASITTSNTNGPTSAFLSARTSASSSNSWCTDSTSTSCTDQVLFRTGTWYAYGNLYNFYTATAGNGTTLYQSASGDICPSGWRLPTGMDETTSEFTALNAAINSGSTTSSAGFRTYPNNFVYSGYMSGTSVTGSSSQGRYASSHLFASSGTRYVAQLRIQNSGVNNAGGFAESLGIAVRCVKKKTKTYTLTYNANSGSGAPSSQSSQSSSGFVNHTVSSTVPTRSGYAFLGWSESSTATNASYTSGETYQTASTSATLYAVWRKEITLTYNANGGSGGFSVKGRTTGTSYTFTIASDVPTNTNATFLGWADSATATSAQYTSGNSLTLSSNKTIYAVWRRVYTLDFNSDGGSPTPSTITYTTVNKTSQTFTVPSTVPSLSGATFKGWSFTCSSAYPRTSGLYQAGSTYTTNAPLVTLHLCAVWEREYSIYLDYNNGIGGKGYIPTTTVYPYKFKFESYDNPEWSGHTFLGWSMSANSNVVWYVAGDTYTFPADVYHRTFYAVWR